MNNRREFLQQTGAVILGVAGAVNTVQAATEPGYKYLWHRAENKRYYWPIEACGLQMRKVLFPREFELIVSFGDQKEVVEIKYVGFNVSDRQMDYINANPLPNQIEAHARKILLDDWVSLDKENLNTFMDDWFNCITNRRHWAGPVRKRLLVHSMSLSCREKE